MFAESSEYFRQYEEAEYEGSVDDWKCIKFDVSFIQRLKEYRATSVKGYERLNRKSDSERIVWFVRLLNLL